MLYSASAVLMLIVLFPLYWMGITSIKAEPEIYRLQPTFYPHAVSFIHYARLMRASPFVRYFINSTMVACVTVVVALCLSVPAGYSLGRLNYRGRNQIWRMIIVFYLFPGVLLLVPLYVFISKLGLQDNLIALVLVYVSFQAPYCTVLLRSYFLSIPRELEEAAMVDGASRLRTMVSIVLPLAKPGIAAAAIASFIGAWSEFMMASLLMVSRMNKTIPVGLYEAMGTYHIDWGVMTAGAVITTIPVLIFFAVMGRVFVAGLLGGALKG